jgi:hypothetical protein
MDRLRGMASKAPFKNGAPPNERRRNEREIEEDVLPYIPVDKQKRFLITAKDVEKQVLRILRKLVPEVEWAKGVDH